MSSPDEIRSEYQRLAERMEELRQELLRAESPPPPSPTAKERARSKGWLLGIPALGAPAVWARANPRASLAALVAAATVGAALTLLPVKGGIQGEPIAAPPTRSSPALEPAPEPPTKPRRPEQREGAGRSGPPEATRTPGAQPTPPAPDQPAPEPRTEEPESPRDQSPDQPPAEPPSKPPAEPKCSIVHLDAGVVEACLLPE